MSIPCQAQFVGYDRPYGARLDVSGRRHPRTKASSSAARNIEPGTLLAVPGTLLAAAVVLGLSAVALGQEQEGPPTGPHQEANEWFFGLLMVALIVVPIVIAAVLAVRRARSSPSKLPVWDDETFEEEVLHSRMPVLVHVARDWNITSRAALAQTEIMAYMNRGAVRVGCLDMDESPAVMERFPGLEPPAYLLFYEGHKLFHRPGLWQAEDLQQHIDVALSREGY